MEKGILINFDNDPTEIKTTRRLKYELEDIDFILHSYRRREELYASQKYIFESMGLLFIIYPIISMIFPKIAIFDEKLNSLLIFLGFFWLQVQD